MMSSIDYVIEKLSSILDVSVDDDDMLKVKKFEHKQYRTIPSVSSL